MSALTLLWLPILVSAALVFVVSSLIHMALPWHKGDYRKLPNEEGAMAALRPLAVPRGDYMMPRAGSMKEMGSPEFSEKLKNGPVMILTVLPNGPVSMGKSLVLWFLYCVAVGACVAYVTGAALHLGAPDARIFRLAGVTAFAGYSVALWQASIWAGRAWSTTIKSTVDGLIYALVTAGTFVWLWP